jgi:hypothetical protein
MSTFQQQMMDSYPQDPSMMASAVYPGADTYSSSSSSWSWPTLKDPVTGAYTPFAATLILSILFLVLASPPVFQFVSKLLAKIVSSVSWISPSGMPSGKLLIVHTLVFGILAYIALCLLTNAVPTD